MTEHKLNTKVDEVLKHYGISGMKWGVKRTEERISSAEDGTSGGGGGEEDESFLEEIENLVDAMQSKMSNIKDSVLKSGNKLLASLFGADPKYDPDYSKKMGKAMKKAHEERKRSSQAEAVLKKRSDRAKKYMPKDKDAFIKNLEKNGWKKHKKSNKTLEERGYKLRSGKEAEKFLEKKRKEGYKKIN